MIKFLVKLSAKVVLVVIVISVCWVLVYKWIDVPVTYLMLSKKLESGHKVAHQWVPIENISDELKLAIICSEDQNFILHNGFDTKAIAKVIDEYKRGKKLRGASTITQQTAKNVFLWSKRSWLRKGLESYFTFLIELLWSKERILEIYLNSIEMGDQIFGAEAAAKFWFNKGASNLNRDEAAAIAAILPNPIKYIPNPPSLYVQQRKIWIKNQMYNYGKLKIEDDE